MKTLTEITITPKTNTTICNLIKATKVARETRKQVDAIERNVLAETPLFGSKGEIKDPGLTYLCEDNEKMRVYWAESSRQERAAGIKPDDMEDQYCPALVAERKQTQAEWAVIEAVAAALGVDDPKAFNNQLLGGGMDCRQRFLDLAVKLVQE